MTTSVANAVFLRAKDVEEEELARRLEAPVTASRSDAGVVTCQLHRSIGDSTSWFIHERYESQEHFDQHRQNATLRGFIADAAMLLDGKLDVRMFTVVHTPHGKDSR